LGFSQTRLNGTGCLDLGDILIQPFTGESNCQGFKSKIDKSTEQATPGYYSVVLSTYGVKAEITATNHVAMHRYSYPTGKSSRLMIDFQSIQADNINLFQSHVLNAEVIIEDKNTISGYSRTNSWLERSYFYVIKFSKPFIKKTLLPKRDLREKAPRYVFDFDLKPGENIMVKISMSSTSVEGAKANLTAELSNWDFDQTHQLAKNSWNKYLSKVDIVGEQKQKNDVLYFHVPFVYSTQ